MRKPEDLSREELEQVVTQIRDVLYLDEGVSALNPDKCWDADACQDLADVLDRYDLVPSTAVPAASGNAQSAEAGRFALYDFDLEKFVGPQTYSSYEAAVEDIDPRTAWHELRSCGG